jgi:hypothetical protein
MNPNIAVSLRVGAYSDCWPTGLSWHGSRLSIRRSASITRPALFHLSGNDRSCHATARVLQELNVGDRLHSDTRLRKADEALMNSWLIRPYFRKALPKALSGPIRGGGRAKRPTGWQPPLIRRPNILATKSLARIIHRGARRDRREAIEKELSEADAEGQAIQTVKKDRHSDSATAPVATTLCALRALCGMNSPA